MHENRRAQGNREGVWAECDLCGGEIGWGESYYRVGGENVCRSCLADFAAQILRVYEVRGGEDVEAGESAVRKRRYGAVLWMRRGS